MAEDFAGVAVVQASSIDAAKVRSSTPVQSRPVTFADRAESGVQLLSRWAGILVFFGTLAAIAYLIF